MLQFTMVGMIAPVVGGSSEMVVRTFVVVVTQPWRRITTRAMNQCQRFISCRLDDQAHQIWISVSSIRPLSPVLLPVIALGAANVVFVRHDPSDIS